MSSVFRTVICVACILSSCTVLSQVVEYEVLPESEFSYTTKDDTGEDKMLAGNIKGLCRVILSQRHGWTSLSIDSLHMTSLADPEVTVTGTGNWDIQYGSAEIAQFGLQVAAFSVRTEHDDGLSMFTWPEFTIAPVEFPAVQETLRGNVFGMTMSMFPAGDEILRFFRRGDVDGDEDKDITDAMVVLLHLFQGGEAPACQDAEDVNDDGRIDLGDAVYLLNRLFLGGARTPVPSQHCGIDPTDDDLDCQGQQACITIDRIE